jgi:hypothetical protein
MKTLLRWMALGVAAWFGTQMILASTNAANDDRVLMIGVSSMPVTSGKATLIVGPLRRVDGVYVGDYRMKVSPFFFKNERGTLAIVVSNESLDTMTRGQAVAIIGTATTNGKGGKCRHIDATATPADVDHGMLKLWFVAGERKMLFEPTYHFVNNTAVKTP